jgi:hypothetical protein
VKLREVPNAVAMAHMHRVSIGMRTEEDMCMRSNMVAKTMMTPASEAKAAC